MVSMRYRDVYACHEGNYGMEGILAGHRAEERELR